MINFENEPSTWMRLDYKIMMHGFLKPYINDAELRKDVVWLESEKYQVIEFDCREWDNEEKIHFFLSGKIDYVKKHSDKFP